MAPFPERRRSLPLPAPPTETDPSQLSEALRRPLYLISCAVGLAVLFILIGLELVRPHPALTVIGSYGALLVICLWALRWLLLRRPLLWAERTVVLGNVVAVLVQFAQSAQLSGPPGVLMTASTFGMLLAMSMLGYLILPRGQAAALSFGTYALGVLMAAVLGAFARDGLDLLRVHLSCVPLLLLLHALSWYRDRFTREYTQRLLLQTQARTDPLTGLGNRRALYDQVDSVLLSAAGPGSVILLDLDHFKSINDQHGHQTGDDILKLTAATLRAALRDSDLIGRWGGEEFLILLPHTPLDAALNVAERLRAQLHGTPHPQVTRITASFGVAAVRPGDDLTQLIARADAALYRAKAQGRNTVAPEEDSGPVPSHPTREAVPH